MDINQIKNLMQEDKAKIIIVENGRPVLVIVSFDEYQKKFLKEKKKVINSETGQAILDTQNEKQEKIFQSAPEQGDKGLTIDDLPF